MLKHYFKNTLRIISRRKVFSIINLIGLSIGLASAFLIFLFVYNELSYNDHIEKKDKVYRILFSSYVEYLEKIDIYDVTTGPLLPALLEAYPEIENGTRVRHVEGFYVKFNNNYIDEKRKLATADTAIFNLFSIPIIKGSVKDNFDKSAIVISESAAKKYFPNQNPIGQELEVLIRTEPHRLIVKAVMSDIKATSTFQADFIVNIEHHSREDDLTDWQSWSLETYVQLGDNIDPRNMGNKFPSFVESHHEAKDSIKYLLQNIADIYLNDEFNSFSGEQVGNKSNVILFSIIALFIIIVASLNYIILSISQAELRTREIAIRKVVGASKRNLIQQQFFEAILMVLIALPIALTIAEILLPSINQLFNKELDIRYIENWDFTLAFVFIAFVVAFFSGSYIAFYLSRFEANDLIQKKYIFKQSKNYLSKGLIIVQLAIFIILFLCSSIIREQIRYTAEKELGFNKEHLLNINCGSIDFNNDYYAFKNEVEKIPGVVDVSGSNNAIGSSFVDAFAFPHSSIPDKHVILIGYNIELDYLDAIQLKLLDGRYFDARNKMDSSTVILNETAIEKLGIEGNPIGQSIKGYSNEYKIIGIVKDFNYGSLRHAILPLMLQLRPKDENVNQVIVRLEANNITNTVSNIEETWKEVIPNFPIEYRFMDQTFENFYREDKRLGNVVNVFSILAIFIAALGLFGLSLLIANNKIKLIGIHKVFGATSRNIINLIFKEYFILIVIANILAWPLVYYYMNMWLDTFEFHISIEVFQYVMAFLVTTIIVFATMGFISFKAANSNPSDSLRYE